ncbi:MAG: hypothetical protein JWO74_70 [Solirubrobacterales bacterium]|jgi:hypothetical protein|nr:hypothetical protein [Solirubrobacterales bacterium]
MERRPEIASAGLVGLAGPHVAWAAGSSWPSADRHAFADSTGASTPPCA